MHILHTISTLDVRAGGPVVALAGLASAQREAGLDVSIVATFVRGDDDGLATSLRNRGIVVKLVGPVGRLGRHRDLKAAVRECVADSEIVHIHGLWEEILHLAAGAAKQRGIPYVICPHGMLDPWSLRQSRWKKRLYMAWRLHRNLNDAGAIHFTTSIERDLTIPLHLRAPPILEPNGVDPAEFINLPPGGTFRASHPIGQGRPLVLFMSRLHYKKGLDKLIPAFARLKHRDAVLAIVGPDSDGYRAAIERMIAEAGLAQRVFLVGMLRGADRIAALADADLFVLPSYQENFGVVVVEALAAGTPVVISDQVNLHPEVTAAGVGGVVPMDTGRLAEEIDRWLGDESLRRSAGDKARVFALDRFPWHKIAGRWAAHYERLARRGKDNP